METQEKKECPKSPTGTHDWIYPRMEESLDKERKTILPYCKHCHTKQECSHSPSGKHEMLDFPTEYITVGSNTYPCNRPSYCKFCDSLKNYTCEKCGGHLKQVTQSDKQCEQCGKTHFSPDESWATGNSDY